MIINLPVMLIPKIKSSFIENERIEIILGNNGAIYLGSKENRKIVYKKISFVYEYLIRCREDLRMIDYDHLISLI